MINLSPKPSLFVNLQDGDIVFYVAETELTSSITINDGEQHRVYLEKTAGSISLQVDNGATMKKQLARPLNVAKISAENLYMGGLPSEVSVSTGGLFAEAFAGCVHGFRVHNHYLNDDQNGKKKSYGSVVDFSDHHLNHQSVGVVSSQECSLPAATPTTPMPTKPPFPVTDRPPFPVTDRPPFPVTDRPPFPATDRPPFPVTERPTTVEEPTTVARIRRDIGMLNTCAHSSDYEVILGFDGSSTVNLRSSAFNLDKLSQFSSSPLSSIEATDLQHLEPY